MEIQDRLPGRSRRRSNYELLLLDSKLDKLDFLKEPGDFTTEELGKLIRILFQRFRSVPQKSVNLEMIACSFEKLAKKYAYDTSKKCDLSLLETALYQNYFKIKKDFFERFPNISLADYTILSRLLKWL